MRTTTKIITLAVVAALSLASMAGIARAGDGAVPLERNIRVDLGDSGESFRTTSGNTFIDHPEWVRATSGNAYDLRNVPWPDRLGVNGGDRSDYGYDQVGNRIQLPGRDFESGDTSAWLGRVALGPGTSGGGGQYEIPDPGNLQDPAEVGFDRRLHVSGGPGDIPVENLGLWPPRPLRIFDGDFDRGLFYGDGDSGYMATTTRPSG